MLFFWVRGCNQTSEFFFLGGGEDWRCPELVHPRYQVRQPSQLAGSAGAADPVVDLSSLSSLVPDMDHPSPLLPRWEKGVAFWSPSQVPKCIGMALKVPVNKSPWKHCWKVIFHLKNNRRVISDCGVLLVQWTSPCPNGTCPSLPADLVNTQNLPSRTRRHTHPTAHWGCRAERKKGDSIAFTDMMLDLTQ